VEEDPSYMWKVDLETDGKGGQWNGKWPQSQGMLEKGANDCFCPHVLGGKKKVPKTQAKGERRESSQKTTTYYYEKEREGAEEVAWGWQGVCNQLSKGTVSAGQ